MKGRETKGLDVTYHAQERIYSILPLLRHRLLIQPLNVNLRNPTRNRIKPTSQANNIKLSLDTILCHNALLREFLNLVLSSRDQLDVILVEDFEVSLLETDALGAEGIVRVDGGEEFLITLGLDPGEDLLAPEFVGFGVDGGVGEDIAPCAEPVVKAAWINLLVGIHVCVSGERKVLSRAARGNSAISDQSQYEADGSSFSEWRRNTSRYLSPWSVCCDLKPPRNLIPSSLEECWNGNLREKGNNLTQTAPKRDNAHA